MELELVQLVQVERLDLPAQLVLLAPLVPLEVELELVQLVQVERLDLPARLAQRDQLV